MSEVHLTPDLAARLLAEVEKAEARAKADHESGKCKTSEWSCSYCEKEGGQ